MARSTLSQLSWIVSMTALITAAQARTCLPAYKATTSYVGCYHDPNSPRDLAGPLLTVGNLNSPQYCANICGAAGYSYAGVEFTVQCFCGHRIESSSVKAGENECTSPCPADGSKMCGGGNMINIYQVSNPAANPPLTPSFPDCTRDPLCSNDICDNTKSITDRANAIVKAMNVDEKVANVGSGASGSARLGLPAYQWQNEALHGVAGSTGVQFQSPLGANFSAATSFPMPILLAAAFDNDLVKSVATVISTEARAFANYGFAGLDFWTPNINPFRDPRWGRGMETPGEDPHHISEYVLSLVDGLQGGIDPAFYRTLATCKHYAAYDIENGRTNNDIHPSAQDMSDYYLPMFQTCVRDAKVASIMCAYNSVDGVPACADSYLLEGILREDWGFTQPHNYVVSDCDAVENVWNPHGYAKNAAEAAAFSLNAGTDLDCGSTFNNLNVSLQSNLTTEATLNKSLVRLYAALIKVGYFDNPAQYKSLGWANVNTTQSQSIAYQAAVSGMTLLKNDGTLPLSKTLKNVAVIGPWADVTEKMQGNYAGTAPLLISPLSIFKQKWTNVKYAQGADINSGNTGGFAAALDAARNSDYIVYLGGIDTSVENEGFDRTSISWPGNQLDLINQLSNLGKPLVVVQFGGGQIDDSALLSNSNVKSVLWAGYPGQDGGNAVFDVLTGVSPPAGRLTVTQYPANYVNNNNIFDMSLRPSNGIPGRTYKWYTGKPIIPFGYGLHYTGFNVSWAGNPTTSGTDVATLVKNAGSNPDRSAFIKLNVAVKNTGSVANLASDYVALVFASTTNAGPSPYPNKELVSYGRLHKIGVGQTQQLSLTVNLGSLARADTNGDRWIYPGDYTLAVDVDAKTKFSFKLTGQATKISTLRRH
ncbi:putative exo-1,4-beta-xylosidase bxlB [Cladobotryum mycophilum]|uniref:xylan 1,4-beta-xylosidase n=1 Tax=Cladobotryum mycophilum TaxID=491253 RepID=A0ABR0SQ75_9HYPO